MKRVLLFALAAALTLGAGTQEARAQKFELGARIGVGSQNMNFELAGNTIGDVKASLGWNAAVVSRIRIVGFGGDLLGAGLFFQPEMVYSQSNIKMDVSDKQSKVRVATVDVPLLLSLKVSIARIQAGPVFNLMNNFNTVSGEMEFLPLRSAVGYALGASVDLGPLVIDGRYHGDFKDMSFKGDWQDVKSRFSSWSVGVGIMF